LSLLPLFCAFAAVVTGGAGSGVGVTAGAAALPFPFPFPLACAVSAALPLVCGEASGVTGAPSATGGVVEALSVDAFELLLSLVVPACGSLAVSAGEEVAFVLPLPVSLAARARAGDARNARMQINSATSRLWMRLERVEVQHVGVPTDPNRSPSEPSRKSSPFASLPREGEC
jgi:hypothetical protein